MIDNINGNSNAMLNRARGIDNKCNVITLALSELPQIAGRNKADDSDDSEDSRKSTL